jgi:hypothetical protein
MELLKKEKEKKKEKKNEPHLFNSNQQPRIVRRHAF